MKLAIIILAVIALLVGLITRAIHMLADFFDALSYTEVKDDDE